MTNFNAKKNAVNLIDEIFEMTNEETIWNVIDEPIEKALNSFNFEFKDPVLQLFELYSKGTIHMQRESNSRGRHGQSDPEISF